MIVLTCTDAHATAMQARRVVRVEERAQLVGGQRGGGRRSL